MSPADLTNTAIANDLARIAPLTAAAVRSGEPMPAPERPPVRTGLSEAELLCGYEVTP